MNYPSHSLPANDHSASAHLSEDQIEDFLMEVPEANLDSAPARHLAACKQCQAVLAAEASDLAAAIGVFNQATLASAQARSNTIPLRLPTRTQPFGLPAWSLAAAIAVTIGIAVQAGVHQQAAWSAPRQSSIMLDQETEIAQDNVLLDNIGQAIDAPVASPAALFHAPTHDTER